MGEPFKNNVNRELLEWMAGHLARVEPGFRKAVFLRESLRGLEDLELKARVHQVRDVLVKTLPEDLGRVLAVFEAVLAPAPQDDSLDGFRSGPEGLAGWALWPLTEYVALRGPGSGPLFEPCLENLRQMTQRFTAEFAVRPFLVADERRALAVLEGWARDPSPHVRRAASEGSRPRLPWGLRLGGFIERPEACMRILDTLWADPSEYVRRSVANHLNDISKDHPSLAVATARRWLDAGIEPVNTRRLVSHALRGLVKAGDPAALGLLGCGGGEAVRLGGFRCGPKRVSLGGTVELSFELENEGDGEAVLVVDYAVHHMKADGSQSPKVFKGTKCRLAPGEKRDLKLRHVFRKVTTRRHYEGAQKLEVLVNGRVLASAQVRLFLTEPGADS